MNTLYIRVSHDEYEFITAVADSLEELAKICGATKNSIASHMSHSKAKGAWCKYRKVEVDDDEAERRADGDI